MGKFISNYDELPVQNKNIYDLVQEKSDGNVSVFADIIGVKRQVLDRIFKKDKRNDKYPSVSENIKEGIKKTFGIDELQLLSNVKNGYMQSIGERISYVISYYCNGNKAEFARRMEEKPQTISSWLVRDVGKSVVNKIISRFPDVNPAWLLTGEGNKLNSEDIDDKIEETKNQDLSPRELLDIIHDLTFQGKQNADANERNSRNIEKLIGLLAESLKQERQVRSDSGKEDKNTA